MSIAQLRTVAATRRAAGDRVIAALEPAENFAHLSAIEAANLVRVVLQVHADSHLPPSAGMEAVTLLSEASHLAAQSRAKIGAAHVLLRQIADQHKIVYAGPPNCPPNETISPFRGA